MTKKFHLFWKAPKNEWLRAILKKPKQSMQMVLRLFWKTYWCEILSTLIIIQNIPWIPLWFSHWRMESKHCMGTELTKALWEKLFHSHGWILVILACSYFHTSKVWGDKELCLGWFWNPSVSTGPERTPLRKGFLPTQISEHFKVNNMPSGTQHCVSKQHFPEVRSKVQLSHTAWSLLLCRRTISFSLSKTKAQFKIITMNE